MLTTATLTGANRELEPLRAKWGWIVALGAAYLIVGVIALGSVVMATAASVFFVGIMMVIAGAIEVINAFQIKTWGRFLLWLSLGALYVIAGFLTFANPLLAASLLTLMLGFALLISGVMRMVLAFSMKEGGLWIWPVSGLYVLGIFLGIDLVVAGASWVAIGFGLRKAGIGPR